MPYVESLIAAFQRSSRGPLPRSLHEAHWLLASARNAEERGKALAAVASALVREHSMSPQSSLDGTAGTASALTSSVRDACDEIAEGAESKRSGSDSKASC